jgi:excisionase family DNA binding protein
MRDAPQAAEAPPGDDPQYLTVREAAGRLALSPRQIYDLIKEGEIRAKKFGSGHKGIRVIAESLDAYEANAPEVTGT